MEVAGQAGQTALFGLGLWLKCALVGTGVGAAVAAAQVFPGRWHPAWAGNLLYWFSCPFLAGFASGVLLALKSIPSSAQGRTLWLLLCLVIGSITAVVAAGAVAYLSRAYDPNTASKSKRISQRSRGKTPSLASEWEERLRSLFRPAPIAESMQQGSSMAASNKHSSVTPGQKAKLPPARFPIDSPIVKPPHYAGHPRQVRLGRQRLEKPTKEQ